MSFLRSTVLAALTAAVSLPASRPLAAQLPAATPSESIIVTTREGTRLGFDLAGDGRITFDLLGELWVLPPGGGRAHPLTDAVRDTAEDLDPSWSPRGDRIVFRGERSGRTGLWLVSAEGGAPVQLTQLADPDGYDGDASWSPDGSRVAFTRLVPPDSAHRRWRSRLVVLDPVTREQHELAVPDSTGPLSFPSWHPDGRHLLAVSGPPRRLDGGAIRLVDIASGRVETLDDSVRALAPVLSPDGTRLAWLGADDSGRVAVWTRRLRAPGASRLRLTREADVTPTRVRWSADGRWLVYGADGRLWKVEPDGGAPQAIPFTARLAFARLRPALPPVRLPAAGVSRSIHGLMGMALSADGQQLALLALGKLWVMPVHGSPREIVDVPPGARQPAWSPDGGTVVWSAGPRQEEDLYATLLATATTRRVTALPGREELPAWSPDGRYLLFVHHVTEDSAVARVVDGNLREVSSADSTRAYPIPEGADLTWSPASDGILAISGGFGPGAPTVGEFIPLAGPRRPWEALPDSPLYPQWTSTGLLFLRHARVWRTRMDSGGHANDTGAEGDAPAHYLSAAPTGDMVFVSTHGLVYRDRGGHETELGWPVSYTPPEPEPLLIRDVRIIDGTGRRASTPRDILLTHGRIERITRPRELPGTGVRELDGDGRWIMPGLMDLHAHIYRTELLPGYVYSGVTTVRDQGSPVGPLAAWADAIAAGIVPGPRVDLGGIQYYSDWGWDLEDGQGVEPEADAGHVRRAISLAAGFGAGHIKTRTFRRWDINARMIAEGHRLGLRATGHCAHPLPLVAAGMDAKEHAGFCEPRADGIAYDDLVQLYRAARIAVVPTLAYSSFAVRMREDPHVLEADSTLAPFLPPASDFQWMLDLDDRRLRAFREYARTGAVTAWKLARAGVVLGTGTDIWQTPTGVHMELEDLVAAGLSPLLAIRAATSDAARILGAEGQLGVIAPGHLADLVLLEADPTRDIRNTRRIRAVIIGGRIVDRTAILDRYRHSTRP